MCTLTAVVEYLQKCYINSRHSPTVDEWPPYQPAHYTTLALIHHKDRRTDATVISVTQGLSVTGKFQNKVKGLSSSGGSVSQMPNIYSNTTRNISDIFKSVTGGDGFTINPCIILIEGAPGIGKTVLSKETAFQWAEKELLRSKKILLLLFLRECSFKNIKKPKNLVQHVVKSDKMAASLTEYLLKTEGEDLAIVIDGYDEISAEYRKSSIIVDIIYRRLFAKCCLVITSRPTASAGLHSIVDYRVEIVGFTEEDRLDYIQTALKGNNSEVEELTHYLQSNPTINALCYIPLNMTILLCLVEDGIDKLPKTQTDMYRKFTEMTILHFITKIDSEASKVITVITELPPPYNKMFEELAKLAYKALNIDKIVFTLKEIRHDCPTIAMMSSNWSGLGLLKSVQYSNAEIGNVTFHFLHFSIQEYMAAWYISTLSNNEQIKLLKKTFWEHRYYNTWIMYVGITHGNSFALKHFLSGNWFQLFTKIFKSSRISNKFLKNKIICLHLFQCFVESNNEDMIASVSHFLQGNQIDLSNQTLLPSDINTLGFFLIRSINKNWEMLNLSGCNIGSIGINILCDRFLDKNKHHNITIEIVDFSFNKLNLSTLVHLFDLFKSWHTSEIIIIDSEETLQITTIAELYTAIEDAFVVYDSDIKVKNIWFGSFLFAHGINIVPLLLNEVSLISMYLMDCHWELPESVPEQSIHKSVEHHRFNNIHAINTSFPGYLFNIFTNFAMKSSIFVYNLALSDQDANELWGLIPSRITCGLIGVILVISSNKIQGIINTSSLNTELSRLEILNLSVSVRALYSNTMQTCPWRQDLCCNGSGSDLMINTFIEIFSSNQLRDLKIALREKGTLIAYNVDYSYIHEKVLFNKNDHPLRTVYLSNCTSSSNEQDKGLLFDHLAFAPLTSLYIHNCYLEIHYLTVLFNKVRCKEIFIHNTSFNTYTDSLAVLMSEQKDCSILLVARNMILGYKPTTKQIAIVQQLLDPSINALKLMNYKGTFETFNQVIRMLVSTSINWINLDFSKCSIGENECDVLYRCFKTIKCSSTVYRLIIPSINLTMSVLSKLTEIILLWKVQELILYNNRYFISEDLIYKFKHLFTNKTSGKINLSVTYNSKKVHFICNFSWNIIADIPKVSTLYFINCFHPSSVQINPITSFAKLPVDHISQIYIINSTLYDNDILNFLEMFLNRKIQLSIYHTNMSISSEALYSFITKKEIYYQSKFNFVAVMENFMCGYNATRHQLHLLQSQRLSDLEHAVVSLAIIASHPEHKRRVLFLFENNKLTALQFFVKESFNLETVNDLAAIVSHNNSALQYLDLAGNNLQASFMMIVAKGLKEISTLKGLNISNNHITKEAADDIAATFSHNIQLQQLDVSHSDLQTAGAITLAKGLHNITTLTKFCISNNKITEKAASDVAVVLSYSTQLQELDISYNDLQTAGAITLAKGLHLHNITTLTKFYISNNSITEEAAGDIALALSHNIQLQELDISDNHIEASGAITLAKGLHNITKLIKFCISNNCITEEAAGDIAFALSHNTQLQELDISDNHIKASGTITLARGLHNITTLKVFCISDNDITEEAAGDIARLLYNNTQLQKVDIAFNELRSGGIKLIAEALKHLKSLQVLRINNNKVTDIATKGILAVTFCNVKNFFR